MNLTIESRLFAIRVPRIWRWRMDSIWPSLVSIRLGCGDFLTNRVLSVARDRDGLRVWRDRTRGLVGVTNRWASIMRPWRDVGPKPALVEMTRRLAADPLG